MQVKHCRRTKRENSGEKRCVCKIYGERQCIHNALQDKKYLMQLYRALHPEDTETTEDELYGYYHKERPHEWDL